MSESIESIRSGDGVVVASSRVSAAPLGTPSACLVVLVAFACAGCAGGGPGGKTGEILYAGTEAELDTQLARDDRPLLAVFELPGCPACIILSPRMDSLAAEYTGKARFMHVDSAQSSYLRRERGVSAFPTAILFVDGRERARWVNEHRMDTYRQALDREVSTPMRQAFSASIRPGLHGAVGVTNAIPGACSGGTCAAAPPGAMLPLPGLMHD